MRHINDFATHAPAAVVGRPCGLVREAFEDPRLAADRARHPYNPNSTAILAVISSASS